MEHKNRTRPLVAAAGAVLLNLTYTSIAQAYTTSLNGRIGAAGNPHGSHMVDIGISSRSDIGRELDPIKFSTVKGTQNGNDVLSEDIIGEAILTVLSFSRNLLSFTLDVSNSTTPTDPNFKASIVSLWFGVSPDITGATVQQGNTFSNIRVDPDGNAPGGFKNIDICIFGGNRCSGGNVNKGLLAGNTDSFRVDIHGNFGVKDANNQYTHNEVIISDFGVKWQTSDGSYEVVGVPEPITILGSGAALAFGVAMKRRHSKKLAS